MKKQLFFCLALLAVLQTKAQNAASENETSDKFGFRFALALPNWSIKGNSAEVLGILEAESYTGFQMHLIHESFDAKGHGGSLEIGYSQRGFRSLNDVLGVGEEVKFQLDYLDLAMMPKLRFGGPSVKLNLFAGVWAGYAVNGKIVATLGEEENTTSMDFKEMEIKRFDAGFVLGGGFSFHSKSGGVYVIDARFIPGINNLNKGENRKRNEIHNTGVSFGLSMFFGK